MYLLIKLEVYARLLQMLKKDKNKRDNNCTSISQSMLETWRATCVWTLYNFNICYNNARFIFELRIALMR